MPNHHVRNLIVTLLVGVSVAGLVTLNGCGGGSDDNPSSEVDKAVNEYQQATTPATIQTAVVRLDDAVGVTTPGSPYNIYAMTAEYRDWFVEQALFDKQYGNPATLGQVLTAWRNTPESQFNIQTNTFLADLAIDIDTARMNPTAFGSNLLLLIDKLGQALNPGISTLTANSNVDIVLSRMLAIWSNAEYAPSETRADSPECKACIAAWIAQCDTTYNNKLIELSKVQQAANKSTDEALARGLITQNQALQQYRTAKNAYDAGAAAAKAELGPCKQDARNQCQAECHQQ